MAIVFRLAWWVGLSVVGLAIVVGTLAGPRDSSAGAAPTSPEPTLSRDRDGRIRVRVGFAGDDNISTIILQEKNGREFMVVHLWKNGDFNFNLGDDLSARLVGDVRRKTGRFAVVVGDGKTQSEFIVEKEKSPHLRIRTLDDPAGHWQTLTPEDDRP
jgi:hypothetical protein